MNKMKNIVAEPSSAEMYYNYSSSGSYSYSDSTFQQSNANVGAPEALFSPSGLSGPDVKKSKEVRKNVPRKISREDYYVQINVSVNEIRRGKRTDRINCYISLRDENDKKFSIYLRSKLTSSIDETLRSIRKNDNRTLEQALLEMGSNCPKGSKFFTGRVKYNPRKWKIEDEHKTNIPSALVGIYDNGTDMTCILFMFDDYHVIELTDDLTTKQQGIFDFTGCLEIDAEEGDE